MGQVLAARQRQDEHLIWQLLHHDHLTGLPNRLRLRSLVAPALSGLGEGRLRVAVLVVGIHHLKHVNDTLGHDVGDFLLATIAGKLSECAGPENIVARLDGDQFAVVLPGLAKETRVEWLAQKILAVLGEPIAVLGHELALAASIGVSMAPDDGPDMDALLRNASIAMERARQAGGNAWQLHAEEYRAYALERLSLEEDLRRALERHEFELHFQPQIDARSGVIDGAEALLRWHRPGHGLASPASFIPLAEESGLIVPIGAWVLEQACMQLRHWARAGARDLRIAVNLSARQFRQKDLVRNVLDTLRRSGVSPESLELEITESLLMQDVEGASAVVQELRQHGVRLALDDFGTGYSSLSYLKRFPFHTLKIDQSFVRHLPQEDCDVAIVKAVIQLAHGLTLQVVAEGVETEEQLRFMREHRCDKIQGYFYSPPVPAKDFEKLLMRGCYG